MLAGGPDISTETSNGRLIHSINELLRTFFETAIAAPEAVTEMHRSTGADIAMLIMKALPRGAPRPFERPENVPADLAMTLAVNIHMPFIGHENRSSALLQLFGTLPWVARAAPEDLYLPRDFIKATHAPWRPENTCSLLRHHRDHYKAATPLPRSQRTPTRNGACPCGSGKKHKRCCGEAA